ncbi:uncharacterized protein STEHIDRAFT_84413 [Stereum hirsutum FP-91666 SS1]|uniref:uncharacterized protein n=1 Tax=Stereum hirsutum (strain FP-91666) TaxID=721885 RepID=UPI000444999E|nr:uncharacterized protein STEHIDRAFT_84413 [Stereum hirsutum FP-91666 SS1]EIM83014.1 hypothetical protein STEHIDRAFT_84413 [Stereum hirsutum FP-91666 SS1]
MQQPTHRHIRIRNARDADILFHAVLSGMLPMITRRLDSEERMALAPGDVYVWQERTGSISESTDHAIERFTEGRSWAASRAKDDFLYYHEKDDAPKSIMVERTKAIRYQEDPMSVPPIIPRRPGERMIKQTYSVYVNSPVPAFHCRGKLHLNAYYTPETLDGLYTVDDIPLLRTIKVPDGWYICARASRLRENSSRMNRRNSPEEATFVHHPYPSATITAYAAYSSPYIDSSASAHHSRNASPPVYWGYPQTQTDFRFPPLPPAPAHRSVSLAPLEQLQNGRHQRRDPSDEVLLRSFNSSR